jgi:hypothetical protein
MIEAKQFQTISYVAGITLCSAALNLNVALDPSRPYPGRPVQPHAMITPRSPDI